MSKSAVRAWIVWGIVFVVYQIISFVLPFPKCAEFWVAWLFGSVAIAVQIYVFRSAFCSGTSAKSKFYGFPIAKISVIYLLVQVVLSFVFMALGAHVPVWIGLVLFLLIFAAAAVGLISTEAMRDEIVRQDVVLKKDVQTMRRLQSITAALPAQAEGADTKAKLSALAEKFRFSDPVSSDQITEAEHELEVCVDELAQAVTDGNAEGVSRLCSRADALLEERNRLCKLNKL